MGNQLLVEQVLGEWRTAPVDARLRAMLAFLEKLTLTPEAVTAADVAPLRAVGLDDAAIEDAIQVTALFSIYDRMADTLNFDVPGTVGFAAGARMLLRRGYA